MPGVSEEGRPRGTVLLETGQRFSSSLVWRLQRRFFEQQGLRAWSEGAVPHYITSNPWIADAYARVVLGWLRDCTAPAAGGRGSFPPLDLRHPVHILELGCGSGRFGYLFLRRLLDLLERSSLAAVTIRYVLTDFTASTLDALRAHPALQGFVAAGLLDFARYDAGRDREVRLLQSGDVLCEKTLRNPLAVIANYVFDGLPQDVFTVRGGRLYEDRVSVTAPCPEASQAADLDDPALLDRIEIEWEELPAAEAPYGDPELDRILHRYAARLDDTTILFPCAALGCVRDLARLADGRLLLLTGDKGYASEELLGGRTAPEMAVHGSFSLMVDYNAIGQWCEHRGGSFLHTSHLYSSLTVVACLLGTPPGGLVETRLAFDEAVERQGPDDFFDLKKAIDLRYEDWSLEQILAWLRFCGWDSNVFLACLPALSKHAEPAPGLLQHEIHRAVQEIWRTHFPIREPDDLAFHLGVLLCKIQCYEDALGLFHESVGRYGANPATLFNIALCLFHLGDPEAARAAVDQALEEAPDFAPAAALREAIAAAPAPSEVAAGEP
jgi:hypothetical protein